MRCSIQVMTSGICTAFTRMPSTLNVPAAPAMARTSVIDASEAGLVDQGAGMAGQPRLLQASGVDRAVIRAEQQFKIARRGVHGLELEARGASHCRHLR